MINNVVLVGRLTRNPELRYTPNGIAVTNFSLAVDRTYTNAQGERETDFINCVIWRKQAETLANYASKGSLIGLTGRIQTRSYENQQGQRVYVTEVLADNFQLLEPKHVNERRAQEQASSGSQEGAGSSSYGSPSDYGRQDNSYASNQPSSANDFNDFNDDPFGGSASPIDISDDDLPF